MFPFKIMDFHKIEKNIDISVFGYKTMEKYPIYVSKYTFERHGHLLLIGRQGKRHYVLVKDCSTFMYVHIPHRERKKFCRYCLQAFGNSETLKCYTNDCL